jgi:CTP:phosphocholine cytidylyltransferase-like protein
MRISWLLILCVLMSCQLHNNNRDLEHVKTEVRETLDDYTADIRTNGLIAEFKYLDSSEQFFWVPPSYTTAISYDSVRAVISKNAAAFKLVDNKWDTLRIIPLSEDLANYTGVLQSNMTLQNDSVLHYRMIETGILIKRDNRWKLLSGQTSVLPN